MPTTALDTLRDRIEGLLTDSTNADWSTGELDNALRLAMTDLSVVAPVHAVATTHAVDDTWEYSLSAISGLVDVVEVWYPYVLADVDYKRPHPVKWRMIDDATLMIEPESDPDDAYDLRIFYSKAHTLEGLDAATVTTVSEAEKSLLVIGAAAFAALGKSRDVTNEVTIGADVVVRLREWGQVMMKRFIDGLDTLGAVAGAAESSIVGWWTVES